MSRTFYAKKETWVRIVKNFCLNEIPRLANKFNVSREEVMQRIPPKEAAYVLAMTIPEEERVYDDDPQLVEKLRQLDKDNSRQSEKGTI